MGACDFATVGLGSSAKEAYRNAVEEAEDEYGHDGYNGTISTTSGFFMDSSLKSTERSDIDDWCERMLDKTSKRGKCACTPLEEGKYLFAGWASE